MIAVEAKLGERGVESTLEQRVIKCSALIQEPNDVIGANEFFAVFPDLVEARDTDALRSGAMNLVARGNELDYATLTKPQAAIAHRDISMAVAASVLALPQNGDLIEADEVVPSSSVVLRKLGDVLDDGIAPRPTDRNYANEANPRRFTNKRVTVEGQEVWAEAVFKVAIGSVLKPEVQDKFTNTLFEVAGSEINDPNFARLLRQASIDYSPMVLAMTLVARYLPSEYFNQELKPFFDLYRVDGKEYFHSGSQIIQNLIADLALWGESDTGVHYNSYRDKNLAYAKPYQTEEFEALSQVLLEKGTLVERLLAYLPAPADVEGASDEQLEKASAMADFLEKMYKFRGPHTRGIHKGEPYRKDGKSTGGEPEMPFVLKHTTKGLIDQLRPYGAEQSRRAQIARVPSL